MDSRQTMIRASDRDRQVVVERLRGALEDGRLKMDEYLDRIGLAYQAVTYGDLVPLYADLPDPPAPSGRGAVPPPTLLTQRSAWAGLPTALKVLWAIWLTVVAVNVVVWLLVTGTTGHLAYPWPVWVAGPYGTVLFAVSAGIRLCRPNRPPAAPPAPLGG
jgi:Domain of unknown function (DUF1707)